MSRHSERHRSTATGWLRAAVLGANDGLVSTASLLVGVASAGGSAIVAGVAGAVAGAMSMAAGEYVSVSSQADTERADLARERQELRTQPESELRELAGIYEGRGLTPALAAEVAAQLMSHDALGAHARDELGMSDTSQARPVQAALASAASFAAGAALPVVVAALTPARLVVPLVAATTLVFLAGLGALAARAGAAPVVRATLRVLALGALAMAATALVGRLYGAS